MQGTMWLFPNSREWRIGSRQQEAGSRKPGLGTRGIKNRKPEADSQKLAAVSQQPEAKSLHCPT